MGLATSEPPKKAPQDRPSPEHAQSASVARTPTETSTETTLDDNALEAAPKADPNAEERLSKSRTYVLIAIVAFTMIMSSGGQQGLNIALPVIQEELGILESNLQWVASAYSLTWGCLLLLSGRIADVYGRKLCFIIGIAWYAIWCLVGSLMHSGAALIVTRALAGAGAAMG
jgi:sugar phosphate permease